MARNYDLGIVNALAHLAGDAAGGPDLLASLLGLGGQSGAEAGPRNDIAHQIALDMQSNLGAPSTEGLVALLREAQALDPSLVPAVDLDDLDPAAVADLMAAIDFEVIFDALLRQTFEGFAARPGVEAQAVPDLAAITATDESEFDDDGDLLGDGEALAEDLTGLSLAALMSLPVGNGISEQAEAGDLTALGLEELMDLPVSNGISEQAEAGDLTALGLEELMDLPVSARIGGQVDSPLANLALHGGGAGFAPFDPGPVGRGVGSLFTDDSDWLVASANNANFGITAATTPAVPPVPDPQDSFVPDSPPDSPPDSQPDSQPETGYNLILGDAFDNVLIGTDMKDKILAGAGDDTLSGLQDGDLLYGESGDDTLQGNQGGDTLFGGDGNDTVFGDQGGVLLYGAAGNDILDGGQDGDLLDGGTGSDSLSGGTGSDVLVWDAADTTIDGGGGTDTLRIDGGDADLGAYLLGGGVLSDLEQVDLATDAGGNTLTLSAQDVLDMTDNGDTLTVLGDGADGVQAGTGWTDGGSAGGFHTYTQAVGAVTVTLVIDDDISINPDIV